jgi:hypothetical protein
VVQLSGRAGRFVVNTSGVELEGVVGSIDGNGDGTNVGNSGLELRFRARGNIVVASDVGGNVLGVVLASLSLRDVWVRSLSVNSALHDVLESIIHQTTVAASVSEARRAVDEVSLRQTNELASLESVLTLNGASGGERPARAALALVLDWSNNTLGSPVNASWEVDLGKDLNSAVVSCLHDEAVVHRSEFLNWHVSELVQLNSESEVLGIVLLNKDLVLLPDRVSVLGLFGRVVLLVELANPLLELVVVDGVDGKAQGDAGGEEQKASHADDC